MEMETGKCLQLVLSLKLLCLAPSVQGLLRPQDSETRFVKSLDGIWKFRISPRFDPDRGFKEKWYSRDLDKFDASCCSCRIMDMPVPSSYNDITQDR